MEGHTRPTANVQTVFVDENMEISFVPATSIMDDNVVRIPPDSGIIAGSDVSDGTTEPVRR
nr:hypothetical protein [Tanacetum cinerariifolium]